MFGLSVAFYSFLPVAGQCASEAPVRLLELQKAQAPRCIYKAVSAAVPAA